ncbi:BspA family leucine-rich repeat surface protein, partial [Winogradskyella pacifica]|uniref:BspA family leucine-rich repeat surface protein n=1 Tax=Winogradskyella pacifica TaxID=664642 RepID=UPI000E234A87
MDKKIILILALIFSTTAFTQDFISIWNTSNTDSNSTLDNQIEIPTNALYTYNYTIDWGDGDTDSNVTGNITHTYASSGSYTINISGTFPQIYFNDTGDKLKIEEILSWGTIQWQSMENAFFGCENLNFDAIDSPDLSQVTSLKNMFRDCNSFNGILNNWDTSTITDLSGTFARAGSFNRPLANWNTSSVTTMASTFQSTAFNEPLDGWNTAVVTDMSNMFNSATNFNQNINNWNVANVTTMASMFSVALNYNQPLNNWNVANVTDMSSMFYRAREFNQPLDNWDVGNVTDMSQMFEGFLDMIFNQSINTWDVSNVTDMSSMFKRCATFNQPLHSWVVTNVTNMSEMFERARSFDQPINSWNVSNVTDMSKMFYGDNYAMAFNQPLDNWGVGNVTDMSDMFNNCTVFNQALNTWDVAMVTTMEGMFNEASEFNQPLNNWITTSLTNTNNLFFGASQFNQPLDNWTVSNVTTMQNMFSAANAFDHPLSTWDISNVSNMVNMLSNSGLSQENYDNTLINWASQSVQTDISLGAHTLTYCDGLAARQHLIDTFNWTITGDTANCSFVLCSDIISPIDGDLNVPANSDIRWNPVANADGYRISIRREDDMGNVLQVIYNNDDIGNVIGVSFTNEFSPGDNVFVTVIPYNSEGPAIGCEEIQFKTIESWVNSPDAFKFTVDTSILDTNSSAANQLFLEVNSSLTYNFSIDWGDNQYNNNVTDQLTHTYLIPGIYTISIIGDYPQHIYRSTNRDNKKLIAVDQWGTQPWQSMEYFFWFCDNMVYNATDVPDLTNVTNMARMFRRNKLFDGDINNWDVSNVTNMTNLFYQAEIFNQPLDDWDVSNVTNMSNMFNTAKAFNQSIDSWNVSSVTSMSDMFNDSEAFNQPLNSWNVGNVTNTKQMFANTIEFNQDLNNWDVSNVTDMQQMFESSTHFNGDISNWNVGNVVNTSSMFRSAADFNQPVDSWNVSSVINLQQMFEGASDFNQPLNSWDVSNAITMSRMFSYAQSFNQLLDQWNVVSVSNMFGMFRGAVAFNQNINTWNVTNVLNMSSMFENTSAYNQPLNQWDVNSVVNMGSMFKNAALFNQPIDVWDVSAVATMTSMFESALVFNQPLNSWNVSSVTAMDSMFKASMLFNNPLNNWTVASVTNMMSMFEDATAFNQPLNNWDTGEVLNMQAMFKSASTFDQNIDTWNVSFVSTMEDMFREASTYNQTMNSWNVASVTTMKGMFQDAISFNGEINSWNVRNVLTMEALFYGASAFNQTLINWRVTGVQTMENMFRDALSYNQSMDAWNIGTVTMQSMFRDASSFNQNLVEWDISNVTNVNNMLDRTALSRENYDATLMAWSELSLPAGLTLGADTLLYCDALQQRQDIIDNYGWSINNDVLDCPIPECTQLVLPLNGATDVPVNTNLTWENVLFASGYRLEITIQPSGTIINENVGDVTSYEFASDFAGGETVSVTIIPFNDEGDAIGPCTEESFTVSTDAATVPDCTNLTLPLNGDTEVMVGTNLSWTPITNANGYRIHVVTNPGGIIILNNEDVGNSTTYNFTTDLPEETLIDVTITPYNDEGDANSCTTESFTTQTIPRPPLCTNLSNPLNNAIDVAIDTNITWNAVTDATGYLISIGTTSGGIEIANSVDVGNFTTYTLPNDLQNSRTYYVTIIPYNAIGDATGCSEEVFTTSDQISTSPGCTNLTSPANGETNVTTTLNQMTWNAAANATSYRITITGSANNDITDFETSNTFYNFSNPFLNGEMVTVSIIPFNATENAIGCSTESFTIIPETPSCTNLVSPIDGATNVAIDLNQLTWSSATNATSYKVTISGTTNNNITDFETTDTFYNFTNPFLNDEVVTVTIIPINGTVEVTGCTSESFTIISDTPSCTNLTSPVNGDTDVATTSNQITWNAVANATAYKITITGTTNNNITDFETTDTFYNFTNPFLNDEVVTVTIIPINGTVEVTGCTSESFTIISDTSSCTNLTSPQNGDTDVATTLNQITWNTVANATSYKVTISGTANNNITNFETTDTFYNFTNPFLNDEVVMVTIIPINGTVEVTGCTAESFTIISNTPSCTNLTSPVNGDTDVATT